LGQESNRSGLEIKKDNAIERERRYEEERKKGLEKTGSDKGSVLLKKNRERNQRKRGGSKEKRAGRAQETSVADPDPHPDPVASGSF
jgi:hypothetical protein